MPHNETDVLIVGGGPVGLGLAIELGGSFEGCRAGRPGPDLHGGRRVRPPGQGQAEPWGGRERGRPVWLRGGRGPDRHEGEEQG